MGRNKIDVTGQKFGKLTAIECIGQDKNRKTQWLCLCECGNTVICALNNLRKGNTQSCGCLRSEKIKSTCITHGKRQTRLYNIWSLMKNRCKDKTNKNYGGRGITVCEEWKNNFEAFEQWALKNGYSDSLSIDRINNNKGYSPKNCRWTTVKTQARNRRTNHFVNYNNKSYLITDLAQKLKCSRQTIARRYESGQKIKI